MRGGLDISLLVLLHPSPEIVRVSGIQLIVFAAVKYVNIVELYLTHISWGEDRMQRELSGIGGKKGGR